MWSKYIATIIAEDRPTIRAMNPTTWIKSTNYPELKFGPSMRAFTKQRRAVGAPAAGAIAGGVVTERVVASLADEHHGMAR